MVCLFLGAWEIWSFGKGSITPEALAVDSEGVVHLVYQSLQGDLIHCWFDGGSWPSETLGLCTAPPVLRVGMWDRGLHILAGKVLTYYYKSQGGSNWLKKSLGYSSSDYDMYVQIKPTIGFYDEYGRIIYEGVGDTFGSFTITVLDSFYVQNYYPYYVYSHSVFGPVSMPSSGIVWYSILNDTRRYSNKGTVAPAPSYCDYYYGPYEEPLEHEHIEYYGGGCPCSKRVSDIACEIGYIVYYNPKYECDYIRTYPMNDTIRNLFWRPDIYRRDSFYMLSVIGRADLFPYLIWGNTYYPVDTVCSSSVSSIVAIDTNNIFIAYVGYDAILRVAHGGVPPNEDEPSPQPGLLFGSVILRGPSPSDGYIRFTAGAGGFMDCRLYRSDGTRVRTVFRDVDCGEEISIPINELGSGVYYLWIRIAGYEKIFRVVLI